MADASAAGSGAAPNRGRVCVFARVRPFVEREVGERPCVNVNAELRRATVEVEDGDAAERVLAGGGASLAPVVKRTAQYEARGVRPPARPRVRRKRRRSLVEPVAAHSALH